MMGRAAVRSKGVWVRVKAMEDECSQARAEADFVSSAIGTRQRTITSRLGWRPQGWSSVALGS